MRKRYEKILSKSINFVDYVYAERKFIGKWYCETCISIVGIYIFIMVTLVM